MSSTTEYDPKIKWALDILDDEGMETVPIARHYGVPLGAALAGFMVSAYQNVISQRPYYAGGPRILGAVVSCGLLGGFVRDYFGHKMAEKEAVMKDYLIKHPELFPEPERKKYGDSCVVLPWPLRR